jgi:phosphoribosylformylglycinamidine synthase
MKYTAEVNVMPLKALLDPQGKTITKSFVNLGLSQINSVRAGKHFTLELEASSKEEAAQLVETACKKLLVNQIMEYYDFEIIESGK